MSKTATPPSHFESLRMAFHSYAIWLISISWKKFTVLSLLFLMGAGLLQSLPPFTWKYSETIQAPSGAKTDAQTPLPRPRIEIQNSPTTAPEPPATDQPTATRATEVLISLGGVKISVPQGAQTDAEKFAQALEDKLDAWADAQEKRYKNEHVRQHQISWGEFLPELAFLLILVSIVIKVTYKQQVQAENIAQEATQTAVAEQLKRQLAEARMSAMQAQVEPHFLFNTLASIDHLIETDPPRASQMQKSLIALLRATLPSMREQTGQMRSLGQELAVIQPYLAIQKVRMEERLQFQIDVHEGLNSALMPSMMIQSLVENAIQHGLEAQPQGGMLKIAAHVIDGQLVITVQDNGVGFGQAHTPGTGFGLNNIRERLHLMFGDQASLTVGPEPDTATGTLASLRLPYRTQQL